MWSLLLPIDQKISRNLLFGDFILCKNAFVRLDIAAIRLTVHKIAK